LGALSKDDFVRILTEPRAALTTQYVELLKTEGVKLDFSRDAIERLADIAAQVNERQENIGARRLHTVLERLLDTLSYEAPDRDAVAAHRRALLHPRPRLRRHPPGKPGPAPRPPLFLLPPPPLPPAMRCGGAPPLRPPPAGGEKVGRAGGPGVRFSTPQCLTI